MDNWTLSPKRADSINAAFRKDTPAPAAGAGGGRGAGVPNKYYTQVLKDATLRDPRGYIIPANQTDFPTAVKFINTLVRAGIIIQKATADFKVNGVSYPAGSYVVKTDQAFRPHVLDMFEPQDHPNDFQYPGGPPIRPYDNAGWTLAFQMGVKFDRMMDGFDGPFKRLPYGELQTPPLHATPNVAKAGYLISPEVNNAFTAVNDLLKAGIEIYRVPAATEGIPAGAFFIPGSTAAHDALAKVTNTGITAVVANKKPKGAIKINALRIGLWDTYGGSIPSGWLRWLMEQQHFTFERIYAQEIDGGNLKSKYDVLVFVGGAIPSPNRNTGGEFGGRTPSNDELPAEYRTQTGRISADKSVPQLKAFLEAGGSIVTIGSSANLAYQLKLPVSSALSETVNGQERPLSGDKFYIPGSILQVAYDTTQPANWGMPATGDVMFDSSPVFKLGADAPAMGIKPLATYPTEKSLRSGWAWGQKYLKGGVASFMAPVGTGKLYVFGPEITFRAQSHGTFKLLFNQLYGSAK